MASSTTPGTSENSARIVVGVDFGTAYSGYAFAHTNDPGNVVAFYQWEQQPLPYCKTLTQLYYEKGNDGSWKATKWGFPAFAAKQLEVRENPDSRWVQRFKLHLDTGDNGISRLSVADNGTALPPGKDATQVIADYLKFLKDDLLVTVKRMFGEQLTSDHIRWCLTVPAMWKDEAKAVMRKSALEAGLIKELNSTLLDLILEPEAAAVYSRSKGPEYQIGKDQTFMVVDAGGGTVDLTVHQLANRSDGSQNLEEVTRGHGESCGGTFVDKAFIEFVKRKLGAAVVDKTQRELPHAWMGVMEKWEHVKRRVGLPDFPPHFVEIPNKMLKLVPAEILEKLGKDQEGYDDEIMITKEDALAIFDPVIKSVFGLIDEQLKRAKSEKRNKSKAPSGVDLMLIVGGFGASPYLVSEIRRKYGGVVPAILSPPDPGSAVVIGAVLYGLDPSVVKARRSRFAYGIRTRLSFDEKEHAEHASKKIFDPKSAKNVLEDVFSHYVEVGDLVEMEQCVSHVYFPIYDDQTAVSFQMYRANKPGVFFTKENGCEKIGEVFSIDVPPKETEKPRGVNADMYFGRAEITLTLSTQDNPTKKVSRTIEFHSSS